MTEKHASFTFARANPPTIAHAKLFNAVKEHAAKNHGDEHIFLSHTQDSKKNPLSHSQKVKAIHKMMPGHNVHEEEGIRTPIDALKHLHKKGYSHVTMFVGGDRHKDMSNLVHAYNGKDYHFKHLEVKSIGDRDPDSDGMEGMSASKMREHAANKKFDDFKKGVANPKHAKELYHQVRKGLKLEHYQALFLVGGPGSGKDFVLRTALSESGAVELDLNKLHTAINEKRDIEEILDCPALIVNGNADDGDKVQISKTVLEALGYTTAMCYVYTTDKYSRERNEARIRKGEKTISEALRAEKYTKSTDNLYIFKDLFEGFFLFDNSNDFLVISEEKKAEVDGWIQELSEGIENFFESYESRMAGARLVMSTPVPKPKTPHPVPDGYERVKQGSFNVLRKKVQGLEPDKTDVVGEELNQAFEAMAQASSSPTENPTTVINMQNLRKKKVPGAPVPGDVQGGIAMSSKNRALNVVADDVQVTQTEKQASRLIQKKPKKSAKAPAQYFDGKMGAVPSGSLGLSVHLGENMKTFKAIRESSTYSQSNIHDDLVKAGLKLHNKDMYDTRYHANHKPEDVHKILTKHGFQMHTHYSTGRQPMPKYMSYSHKNFNGGHAELHHKDGKIHYVTFNHRPEKD